MGDFTQYDDRVIFTFEASRIKVSSHDDAHNFIYVSNNDGTHQKICTSLDYNVMETCTIGADDTCPLCGYHFERYLISGTVTNEATGAGLPAYVQLKDASGQDAAPLVMANGQHTIDIVSGDGITSGTFYIVSNLNPPLPPTGDSWLPVIAVIALALAGADLVFASTKQRKKQSRKPNYWPLTCYYRWCPGRSNSPVDCWMEQRACERDE